MSLAARLVPAPYRVTLRHGDFRKLLLGLAVSYLGDGMSAVAVAWLALELAPPERAGFLVGAAVAAYTLPAVIGAVVLMRWLRHTSTRALVVASASLRASALGAAAALHLAGVLRPVGYVLLLGASALLAAWEKAGTYTLISQLFDTDRRLAANALVSTCFQWSFVLGPPVAGVLAAAWSPGIVLGIDAFSYLVLAVQVGRMRVPREPAEAVDPAGGRRAGAGFRALARRPELVGLLA